MEWAKRVFRKQVKDAHYELGEVALINTRNAIVTRTCRKFPFDTYGVEKSCVGEGVSCKVYLYEHPKTKSLFAVKSFVKKDLKNSDDVCSIEKEIKIHNILNSDKQNVVQLIDSIKIKSKSRFFLILEYFPFNLQSFYTSYGILIPQEDRLCYVKQIVFGLDYLQSQNVGYRDLKPENCCIDYNGNLKLIDFGSSTVGNIGYGMAGSPPYAAPEIHSQLKYDSFKCDMWSLGVLFINLFYLSKQAWKTARYDDLKYMKYKNDPTISNAVRILGNVLDSDPLKLDIDSLILLLLNTDAEARIDVIGLTKHEKFQQIECCIGETAQSHKHNMFQ